MSPSRRQLSKEIIHELMEKKKKMYVVPSLVECHSTIASFNL
jgi:hypothetical protein